MINNLHVIVGDKDGKAECLYVGNDWVASEKAFLEADGSFEAVRSFSHLPYTRIRYPGNEAADAKARAEQAKALLTADARRKREAAAAAKNQIAELRKQITQLESEAKLAEKETPATATE